jgi:hypothetical protein
MKLSILFIFKKLNLRAGRVKQMVEHLMSKHEILSSNPVLPKIFESKFGMKDKSGSPMMRT